MLLKQLDISVTQSRKLSIPLFKSSVSIVKMGSLKDNYALDFKVQAPHVAIVTELS